MNIFRDPFMAGIAVGVFLALAAFWVADAVVEMRKPPVVVTGRLV